MSAHAYARRTLLAGFTTVREAGAGEYIDVALRTALLRDGSAAALLRYAEVHPFDVEILEQAVASARPSELLLPTAVARLAAAHRLLL